MLIFQIFILRRLPSRIFLVQTLCIYRQFQTSISLLSTTALPVRDHPLQTVSDHPSRTDD